MAAAPPRPGSIGSMGGSGVGSGSVDFAVAPASDGQGDAGEEGEEGLLVLRWIEL